jgi:dUTP pyrophosphatase
MFKDFYLYIQLVHPYATMPTRAKDGDAGMDVYTPMPLQIQPRQDALISLGWKCEFPKGFVMLFQEKSGRATKDKLDVGACVVDSGYRGLVHAHLFNNSDVPVLIPRGERVAQFIIVPCWTGQPDQVTELSESDRGEGGFGSTGLN